MDNFDKEAFIEEVEKRPVIWNTECPEYSDRLSKRKAWNELVELFGDPNFSNEQKSIITIKLQRKWKNLKDTYIREYKKIRNHPYSSNQKGSSYIYYSKLSFLQPCIQAKPWTQPNDSPSMEVEQAAKANELLASMNDSIVELMETASSLEKPNKSKLVSQGRSSSAFDNPPYPDTVSKPKSAFRRYLESLKKVSRQHEDDEKSQSSSTKLEYSEESPKIRFLNRDTDEFVLLPRKNTSQLHEDDDKPRSSTVRFGGELDQLLNLSFRAYTPAISNRNVPQARKKNSQRHEGDEKSKSSPMRWESPNELPNLTSTTKNLIRHSVEARKKNSQRHEDDDDKLFCLSLYKEIRKVPEDSRLAVKIELLDVIHKAQIEPSLQHLQTSSWEQLLTTGRRVKTEKKSGQSTSSESRAGKGIFFRLSKERDSRRKLDSPVSSMESSFSSNCSINNNMDS